MLDSGERIKAKVDWWLTAQDERFYLDGVTKHVVCLTEMH